MHGLGTLLKNKGDTKGAEEWYRKAAEAGHSGGMGSLADLLVSLDRKSEAEAWNRRLAESGSSQGMIWLGVLSNERGAKDEARDWFEKAETAGDAWGSYNLGVLLYESRDRDGALVKFHKAADGGVASAMTYLGMLAADRRDFDDAARWYERALEAGGADARERLDKLKDLRESCRLLDMVQFETFGWELVSDQDRARQWRSEGAGLAERYVDQAPDLPSWDLEETREALESTHEFLSSPDFDPEDLPDEIRDRILAGEFPEDVRIVDLELFQVPPAKCVLMINRHRSHGSVHYSAGFLILFAECFWGLMLELEENDDVGIREGAVARAHLELPPEEVVETTFDPYDRKWDGIVPLENDPLARLRILASRLRDSINLHGAALDLAPFSPEG